MALHASAGAVLRRGGVAAASAAARQPSTLAPGTTDSTGRNDRPLGKFPPPRPRAAAPTRRVALRRMNDLECTPASFGQAATPPPPVYWTGAGGGWVMIKKLYVNQSDVARRPNRSVPDLLGTALRRPYCADPLSLVVCRCGELLPQSVVSSAADEPGESCCR
jgi:hypothetical protein